MRFPKSIKILSIINFNAWSSIINTNRTEYETEINNLVSEGIKPISLEYHGKQHSGNYIIADNQGFFNIFRKAVPQATRNPNESNKLNEFTLIKRLHSGFNNIKIIKRLGALIVFSSDTNIGFLRAFDGDLASSHWEVGTSKIVSIDFDKDSTSRFYVGTDQGEIIAFAVKSQEKNTINLRDWRKNGWWTI